MFSQKALRMLSMRNLRSVNNPPDDSQEHLLSPPSHSSTKTLEYKVDLQSVKLGAYDWNDWLGLTGICRYVIPPPPPRQIDCVRAEARIIPILPICYPHQSSAWSPNPLSQNSIIEHTPPAPQKHQPSKRTSP